MVNFNNENTIATPPRDVIKILILQRRNDLIEAIEDYNKRKFIGSDTGTQFIQARLFSLFLEIQNILSRRMSPKDYEKLEKVLLSDSLESRKLIDIFYQINNILDSADLIKIDTRKQYDTSNIETENLEKNL